MKTDLKLKYTAGAIIFVLIFIIFTSLCKSKYIHKGNECIGSFDEFAYDISARQKIVSKKTNHFINENWIFESELPEKIQNKGNEKNIYGQIDSGNGNELVIESGFDFFYQNSDYEDSIDIYNIDNRTWRTIQNNVLECDCIVNKIFIVNNDNIFAINTGNINDKVIEDFPVLSKYNQDMNLFLPLNATKNIFSGTKGERVEQIAQSEIFFDEIDSIWIFSEEGAVYKYNIFTDVVEKIELLQEMEIRYITFDYYDHFFYLLRQNSGEKNNIGIPSDYDILKIPIEFDQIEVISNHPFYWPSSTYLWVDQYGSLWFDTIGYMDADMNWHLLISNIGEYILQIYHFDNTIYSAPQIIAETSNGDLWFWGYHGIGWYNDKSSTGCWDSTYGNDVFEDNSGKIWLITQNSLYSRDDK